MLIDARTKPLHITAMEALGSDNAVVRLSLTGEYKVVDAAVYYTNSANAADTLFVQLRRTLNLVARQNSGAALTAAPEGFAARVLQSMSEPTGRLGLQIQQLEVYEAVPLGFLRAPQEPEIELPGTGLVH